MSRDVRTHDSYSVGIICALPLEKAAMTAMLAEEHPRLRNAAGDVNEYSLGRIGQHNVAVACLPAGVTGKSSAAVVATNMMRSFPIKVGLMVGISGGVPSMSADMRLGDVVVSQPTGQHGGVVQWDFGKMERGGIFRRTGTLNKPPRVLLNALSALQAQHEMEGSNVQENLAAMLAKYPKMAKNYGYQGWKNDYLFESEYDHVDGQGCANCDPKRLVKREPRHEEADVEIHYGNIASGDEVMKDGKTRDRIAAAEGVLCFEMEAAGLMDSFPCLVIRGICDYADSHKYKQWQRYAAATAAAYAKELLGVIDRQDMEGLQLARDLRVPMAFYMYPDALGLHFVRRNAIYSDIQNKFGTPLESSVKPAVVVLLGMGGSGKTQLAVDFCKQGELEGHYEAIFWVDATNPRTLAQSYEGIATTIYGTEQGFKNENELINSVMGTIKRWKARWLMVFDNFDRPSSFNDTGKSIMAYWPSSSFGSILITSRDADSELLGRCVRVRGMELSEGVDVLLRRAGQDSDEEHVKHAETIVELLGYLPLAIDQAGAFISMKELRLWEYPDIYLKRKEEVLQGVPGPALWEYQKNHGVRAFEIARSVFTTWELSFESIAGQPHEKQAKGHFLTLSAFLDRKDVSEDIFRIFFESNEHNPDWMSIFTASGTWDSFAYRNIVIELKRLSLIESIDHPSSGPRFSLHPLVRDWAQLRTGSVRQNYTKDAVLLITSNLPLQDQAKYPNFSLRDRQVMLSHVDAVAENCIVFLSPHDWPGVGASTEFGWRLGTFYSMSSRRKDAEKIWRRILGSLDDDLTVDYSKKVSILLRLAWSLYGQGQHSETKLLRIQAWDLSQRYLGDQDPMKWLAGSQTALTDFREGRFTEAEALLRQCCEKQQLLLGTAHLDTLATIQNLSRLYKRMQRLKDAEVYGKLAVEGYTSLQGPDSSQSLHAQGDLGDLYLHAGRYEEAEKILLDCTTRMATTSGPTATVTLNTLSILGSLYRNQKRYSDAIEIFTKARNGMENSIGVETALYMGLMDQIATTWKVQGELDKAIHELQSAIVKCEGLDRLDLWESIKNLKVSLMNLHRQRKSYSEAEALSEEILAEEKALGVDSDQRQILWATYFLYAFQIEADPSKSTKMEEFLDRAVAETLKVLGPGNIGLVQSLKMALLGYERMEKGEKQDRTSVRLLMLWEDAGGPQYHGRQVDNELAVDASQVLLPPES